MSDPEKRKDVERSAGVIVATEQSKIVKMPVKGRVLAEHNQPYDRSKLPIQFMTGSDEGVIHTEHYDDILVEYSKKLSGREYTWRTKLSDMREFGGSFIDRNDRGDIFSIDVCRQEAEDVLKSLSII